MSGQTWSAERHGHGAYADANGLRVYYEAHGPTGTATGAPLVLLHGGLGSGEMFGPIVPILAERRQVILVDLQGHGRTADIDRPIEPRTMGDDVADLVRRLGLGQVDLLGYSLGGGVALHIAVRHAEIVRKAVLVSAHAYRDAVYPELAAQSGGLNASLADAMRGTPMHELYQRVAPRPEDFGRLLDKMGEWIRSPFDYRADYAALRVPTLIACADADGAPPRHYVELFESLGGGRRDGGWDGSGRPEGGHGLAILPCLTHYTIFASPLLARVAIDFLDG